MIVSQSLDCILMNFWNTMNRCFLRKKKPLIVLSNCGNLKDSLYTFCPVFAYASELFDNSFHLAFIEIN